MSFGIVKTVSSNGRIRGNARRRGFESYTIPIFILEHGEKNKQICPRENYILLYENLITIYINKGGI